MFKSLVIKPWNTNLLTLKAQNVLLEIQIFEKVLKSSPIFIISRNHLPYYLANRDDQIDHRVVKPSQFNFIIFRD